MRTSPSRIAKTIKTGNNLSFPDSFKTRAVTFKYADAINTSLIEIYLFYAI